jgi:hypothetical protein
MPFLNISEKMETAAFMPPQKIFQELWDETKNFCKKSHKSNNAVWRFEALSA